MNPQPLTFYTPFRTRSPQQGEQINEYCSLGGKKLPFTSILVISRVIQLALYHKSCGSQSREYIFTPVFVHSCVFVWPDSVNKLTGHISGIQVRPKFHNLIPVANYPECMCFSEIYFSKGLWAHPKSELVVDPTASPFISSVEKFALLNASLTTTLPLKFSPH